MATGSDAFLWYNVGDWSQYALAVPNFGNDRTSQNDTIRYVTEIIGRNLQGIMWHPDARLSTPPSINTLRRVHKLCTRSRSIFAGRAVPAGVNNMESAHAIPAAEEFRVYPVPYFAVRNQWLKQYCGLTLLALTEAMQHSENAKPLEISAAFAGQVSQYIQRIYVLMATELFQVPLATAQAADFTMTEEQLAGYNPAAWFTSTEMIDTVPPMDNWPTEDDLSPLTAGIPVSQLPVLGPYPSGSGSSGSSGSGASQAAASAAFIAPPAP